MTQPNSCPPANHDLHHGQVHNPAQDLAARDRARHVPVFLLSIALYVVAARMMGAAERYPEGEAADALFAERVEAFHADQAAKAPFDVDTTDRRPLSTVLLVVWIVDLVVIAAGAVFVLFFSPDLAAYTANRDEFFWIAGVGTVIYFVAAYWRLRRTLAFARRAGLGHQDQVGAGEPAQGGGSS